MEKRDWKLLAICFTMCMLTGVAVYLLFSEKQRRIVMIDAVKLFDGYEMKQELEKIEQRRLMTDSKRLDSLNVSVQTAVAMKSEEEIQKATYRYRNMKVQLENEYSESSRKINDQVWKRLNPLLVEFGRKHKFAMIIGANGMGTVLYNDEYCDLTEEAIKFVNSRYAEGN